MNVRLNDLNRIPLCASSDETEWPSAFRHSFFQKIQTNAMAPRTTSSVVPAADTANAMACRYARAAPLLRYGLELIHGLQLDGVIGTCN